METHTNSSATTLTVESLRHAIDMIRESSKQPFMTDIRSKYEWWKLIQKDNMTRNFSLYGGVPCYQDDSTPENIARVSMSDGTFKDFEISNKPNFLKSATHN